MDAATAAAMSDPQRNPAFRRRWLEVDPLPAPRPPALDPVGELDGPALLAEWRRIRAQQGRGGSG